MRGIFVTFEGPDGCGKSTITDLVFKELSKKYKVIRTREPGGTEISETIRDLILDNSNEKMTPRTEALLYAASRAQHVEEKIIPYLEDGYIVLCERFVLSSIAYQGYGRGLNIQDIIDINKFATGVLEPDLCLLFDTKDMDTENRKIQIGGDRMELSGNEFHNRVRNGYKELVKTNEFKVIDATKTIEEVFSEVMENLKTVLEG